jgi:predicted HTH domain antitoxin
MTRVIINLPDSLRMTAFDINMMVAARLFEQGKLSSGQAAEMVGLSKRAFIEVLGKYGVSVFGYDADDLQKDLKNV